MGLIFSIYAGNVSLSSNPDLFRTNDPDLATIRVGFHVKAVFGWAGLGISEIGGIEGTGIINYEVKVKQW